MLTWSQWLLSKRGVHMCAKLIQLCLTLCNSMDCSPPGFSVHGIVQVRILVWVPMPSSWGPSWLRDQVRFSYVSCIGRLFATSATWEARRKKGSRPWFALRKTRVQGLCFGAIVTRQVLESVQPKTHHLALGILLLVSSQVSDLYIIFFLFLNRGLE